MNSIRILKLQDVRMVALSPLTRLSNLHTLDMRYKQNIDPNTWFPIRLLSLRVLKLMEPPVWIHALFVPHIGTLSSRLRL